jgi:hypothetical protein
MMIKFTHEQQRAYDRFIKARNKIFGGKGKWIPAKDYTETVDIVGMNHPLFVLNEDWAEFKQAFKEWLEVEPAFREKERMRSSRGDYGVVDSWEDKPSKIKEL